MRNPVPRLRTVLRLNAAFSLACALVMLVGAGALAPEIGRASGELQGLGVQLLVFAGFLSYLSARSGLGAGWTYWAVLALGIVDLLWVVGTAQAFSVGGLAATPFGVLTAIGVALVVGAFGCLELWIWWSLRRERRGEASADAHPAR